MDPTPRDILIQRVRVGELSPDQAEAEALARGVGQLATEPDPGKYDPLTKTWWTLPMAIAWIAWRRPERVRDFWDEYRRECWDWMPVVWPSKDGAVHQGYDLQRRNPATPLLLSLVAEDSGRVDGENIANAAKAILWAALAGNRLKAAGTEMPTGNRVTIGAYEWTDLDWKERDGLDAIRLLPTKMPARGGYTHVRLLCREILALWQPRKPTLARLPVTETPSGPGQMRLYDAAQWIATGGGAIEIPPTLHPAWTDAYAQLVARIDSLTFV